MMGPEVRHYLDEFRRGAGRPLPDDLLSAQQESEALIRKGKSDQAFVHARDECFIVHPEAPEAAIGFKEPLLLGWIAERGFTLLGKHYGDWCRRPKSTSYQDMLVYKRSA